MQPRVLTGQCVSHREHTRPRWWPSMKARSGGPPQDGQTDRCQLSKETLRLTTRALRWRIALATTAAAFCARRCEEGAGAGSPDPHPIARGRRAGGGGGRGGGLARYPPDREGARVVVFLTECGDRRRRGEARELERVDTAIERRDDRPRATENLHRIERT